MTTSQVTSNSVETNKEIKVAIMRVIRTSDQLDKDRLNLDDGSGSSDFDVGLVNLSQLTANKLYQFSYEFIEEDGILQRKIINYAQPSLKQVAAFNGYHLSNEIERESHDGFWAEPIINIESIALFETVAGIQKLLAECKRYIEEEQFCIAKPSCFCDFSGILRAVDNTAFDNQIDKDISIAGAYLFCVYRSYFAVKSEGKGVSNFDIDILKFIERTLKNLAKTNTELAHTLRQFIRLSELNENETISKLCASPVLIKDFYDVLQPAKDEAREVFRQRAAMGLEDY